MIGSSPRFQKGSLVRVKNKSTEDTWFLRFYEEVDGKRVYRKQKVGTARELPLRRDAERAVLSLRANINSGVRSPETVNDLLAHYLNNELIPDRKAFSTIDVNTSFLRLYVAPQWGHYRLSEIRTVAVERWLSSVPKSPATRTKIKAVFAALFAHAIRHEWIQTNPIHAVRCSAKRLRVKDVLTPIEFASLLEQLNFREKAMVMLAGSTGLRRSEFIGLTWSDIDVVNMEVAVTKSWVRNQVGDTKNEASRKPVPLHPLVLESLWIWRELSPYQAKPDFLFPSDRLKGAKPVSPDTILKKVIRPAVERAGIKGKVIGWHTFRHSLATNLRSMGVDVKVSQDLMRHATSRTTMDVYTQSVSSQRREAAHRVMDLLVPKRTKGVEVEHPSAPS